MGFVVNYPPVTKVTVDETTNEVVVAAAGPRGPQGEQGDPGAAASVAVGSTTTGVAGSDASVANSGTSSAAVLDFTIPRGDTGAQGIQGEQGVPGDAASVTVGTTTTGAEGSDAAVSNSGTSSAAVLDFTIPRGDTGAQGIQGEQGIQGDPGVVAATAPLTYDSGTQTVALDESGIEIAPSQVTGTAVVDNDSRLSDARIPTGTAGGDLTGTYPNPTLASIVTAGTATKLTFDAKGRITAGTTLTASDIPTIQPDQVAGTAVVTGDARLSDARTPTGSAGGDLTGTYPNPTFGTVVAAGTATKVTFDAKGRVTAGAALAETDIPELSPTKISGTAVVTNDARLSDARTPTAHKSTHATGGSDTLTPSDIGAAPSSGISPSAISGTAVVDNDARLTDDRTPTAHAASHGSGGSDAITLAQSQVTDLTTDLSNKAALSSPTFTGTPAAPTAAVDTNTTQLATTAFVLAQAGTATPLVEGSASAGTAVRFAREDHIHPSGGGGTGGSLTDVFMLMGA